jgi:cytochrome c
MGQRLFLTYCAQCHGSDAKGAKGFPNLADQDWLFGGTPDQIKESINKGRDAAMPAKGVKPDLNGDQIKDLANYVRSCLDCLRIRFVFSAARNSLARPAVLATVRMARACLALLPTCLTRSGCMAVRNPTLSKP